MRGCGTGTMIADERTIEGTRRTGTETVTGGETTTGAETMTITGVRDDETTDPGIAGADRARALGGRRRPLATADRPPRTHHRRP